MQYDLSGCTGEGVKIAIIDDGISPLHPDINHIMGGVRIKIGPDEHVIFSSDYLNDDKYSHGTICASITKRKATRAQLYSVRILGDDLLAHPKTLIAAIQWAIENDIQLINLSLGTTSVSQIKQLQNVCRTACEKGIVMVSASHPQGLLSYPACLTEPIEVAQNEHYDGYYYTYHPENRTEFLACGKEQINGRLHNGNSFAAARISAMAALILEKYTSSDLHEFKRVLIANACPRKPRWIYRPPHENHQEELEPCSKSAWIKKAILYPYDEKMYAFIRFADMLDFEIACVVDPFHSSLVGNDAGQVIGCERLGIPVLGSIKQAAGDTVIIGQLDKLKITLRKDVLEEVLVWAIENGKNVFSFSSIDRGVFKNLYQIADEKGLVISSPRSRIEESLPSVKLPPHIDVPVIGVFGTSFNQGKFTTQLALRRSLLHEGYRIAQIGTEPYCKLFGFSRYYPNDWEIIADWLVSDRLAYLENAMITAYALEQPDIFVVGCQGGIVPHGLYPLSSTDIHGLSKTYTLPSIAFLLATRPDAYILSVNSIDPDEFIQDSIHTLEEHFQKF